MGRGIVTQSFKKSGSQYAGFMLSVLFLQWVFRIFEWQLSLAAGFDYQLSDFFTGLAFDLIFSFSFAVFIYPFYWLIFMLNAKAARKFSIFLLVLMALISYGLERYFATVFYPLDAVFFSYSPEEIMMIMRTGGGFDVFSILSIIILFLFVFGEVKFVLRKSPPKFLQILILVLALVSVSAGPAIIANTHAKCSEQTYHTRVNKTGFFISQLRETMAKRKRLENDKLSEKDIRTFQSFYPGRKYTGDAYPLLYTPDTSSTLNVFFRKGEQPPNLVFVIVESLTRCYSGPGAWAGSYTPFLDSLAQHSLYWENFSSTSERTIGVLPGIFGSLPSAKEGFTLLGGNMPLHLSLISILRNNKYHTEFYYGGQPSFDNTNVFLSRQGIDLIQSGTYYKKNGEVYWGLSDSAIYVKSLKYRQLQKYTQPFLSIYLTLSTHGPFDFPGQEGIKKFLLNEWSKDFSPQQKQHLQKNLDKLASYYYMDAQIRRLFYGLKSLGKMENTIFIVTGDHGVVQVCTENPEKRYHIPLIVYSPLLKRSKSFKAVNSHYNITPALLAMMGKQYDLHLPVAVHWLGGDLDTTDKIAARTPFPIMQLNRSVKEVFYKNHFLSKGRLYRVGDNMAMQPERNDSLQKSMQDWLDAYNRLNLYVCEHNRILPREEYIKWGRIYKLLAKRHQDSLSIEPETPYYGIWNIQSNTSTGNYRVRVSFDLQPNDIDPKNYPYFVLDLTDSNGNKIFYNALEWGREGSIFDTSKTNHIELGLETYIPKDTVATDYKLGAYFWNNKGVKLLLKNLDISFYNQEHKKPEKAGK